MADAEDSKSSVGNHVRVQVPLSAPTYFFELAFSALRRLRRILLGRGFVGSRPLEMSGRGDGAAVCRLDLRSISAAIASRFLRLGIVF